MLQTHQALKSTEVDRLNDDGDGRTFLGVRASSHLAESRTIWEHDTNYPAKQMQLLVSFLCGSAQALTSPALGAQCVYSKHFQAQKTLCLTELRNTALTERSRNRHAERLQARLPRR